MLAWPLATLGSAYAEVGPAYYPRAVEMHTHTLELLAGPSGAPAAGTAFADIGFTALEQGRADEAAEAFHKGLNYPSMYRYLYQPQLQVGLALVALQRNQLDAATQVVSEVRAYVEQREMKNLYPLVAYAEGSVRLACGDPERALEEFARAESLASGMRMRPMVWQARASAAKVLTAMGRLEEADVERKGAREVVDEIAGQFTDQEMRTAFVEGAMKKLTADG